MANTLAVEHIQKTRRHITVTFLLTLSGSYVQVAGAGEVLDFTAATDPSFLSYRKTLAKPKLVEITSAPGGCPAEYIPGTDSKTGKLKLFSAANTELAAAAYNAAVSGDANVRVKATWEQKDYA